VLSRILFVLAVFLFTVPQAAFAARPSVVDVRLGIHPERTRVVVEFSSQPRYRVFALANPDRLVVDLSEVDWTAVEGRPPVDRGIVEAIRFGLFSPGTSRMVLDLREPAKVDSLFFIPPREGYGFRMVLDLAVTDRASFVRQVDRAVKESDPPLPPLAALGPGLVAPKTDGRNVVVIDPGHGGVDPGAISPSGRMEKDLTLAYAKQLRDVLQKSGRYRVVLTREDDRFVPLRDRYRIAEQAGAELFVSLHANTHPSATIRGASVFTLSESASDSEAAALAAKENKADVLGGLDLSDQPEVVSQILIDLAQRETKNLSKSFANDLVDRLGEEKITRLNHTHRFAGFAVLKSPIVPSVLVEIGYLSNPGEERALFSADHRGRVVEALQQAIDGFFQVQQAWRR